MSPPPAPAQPVTCLVTGATGYAGGRLVPGLLAAGYRVRCMARRAGRLPGFPWRGQVEVARADALDPASPRRALAGTDVACYLTRALGSGRRFGATGRAAAAAFARCAREAGGTRILCLGGLRPPGSHGLSPHLRSRAGGSLYPDVREQPVHAPPGALWRVIEGIGGQHGWCSGPLAWQARGWLDRAAGGAGLRQGRRDPGHLRAGDPLGFWRAGAIEPGRLLRLRAEMKLPGLAWLELPVGEHGGHTACRQRALFHPRGLAGHLYRGTLLPLHAIVFGGMTRNVTRAAERARELHPGRAGTSRR